MSEFKKERSTIDTSPSPTPITDVVITIHNMQKRMGDRIFLLISPDDMDGFDMVGANNLNSLAFWAGYYYDKRCLDDEAMLLSGKVSNPEIIDPLPSLQVAFLFYGIDKYILDFSVCPTADDLIKKVETIMKNDPKADIKDVSLIIGAEVEDSLRKDIINRSNS